MYALLGSGRLARHFGFYLKTLGLPLKTWSRNGDPFFNSFADLEPAVRLERTVAEASHVLLAIKDSALSEWAKILHAQYPGKKIVHFSGSLALREAVGAHPLMTFGERLETLEWYQTIPFLLDKGHAFGDVLPGLQNPHFPIDPTEKNLYHALCALAGNSTYLLWNKIGEPFESELGLPRSLLAPFLHQVVVNSSLNGKTSGEKNFTGPVARGDWAVVRSHLEALKGHPELQHAYQSYLSLCKDSGWPVPKELL